MTEAGLQNPATLAWPDAASPALDGRPCLVPLCPAGPLVGRRFPLEARPFLLGSDPGCDLRLPDTAAAPRHARLDPGPVAAPLDGAIFVNDEPPTFAPLRSGDYLRLGRCILRYLAGPDLEQLYREELNRLRAFDAWTGLPSLLPLMENLQRELQGSVRARQPLSLAWFALDQGEELRERFGEAGEELAWRQLADRARGTVRRADFLCCPAPGAFAVAMFKARQEDAGHLGERLRRLVEKEPFRHENTSYRATLSIGLTTTRGDPPLKPEELISQATEKWALARRAGGNRVAR